MLIANNIRHDLQSTDNIHTNPQPQETAMTTRVTIFGKNA